MFAYTGLTPAQMDQLAKEVSPSCKCIVLKHSQADRDSIPYTLQRMDESLSQASRQGTFAAWQNQSIRLLAKLKLPVAPSPFPHFLQCIYNPECLPHTYPRSSEKSIGTYYWGPVGSIGYLFTSNGPDA